MRLVVKNNTVSKLLKLGLSREELNNMTTLYENIFELSHEEKIKPSESDENLYILHNGFALHKNEVYVVEYNVDNLKINKIDNDYIIDNVRYNNSEYNVSLLECKISAIGLLIPVNL